MNTLTAESGWQSHLGVVLARVVIPAYFFVGAVFKIIDASPVHLPVALLKLAGALGIDLVYLLKLSIAGELAVAAAMVLIPRLARPIGLALLGLFLPILIGDLMLGASSCGCFGAVEVPPWVTLVIDLGLFFGLWYFGRKSESLTVTSTLPTVSTVVAGLLVVAGFMIGFAVTPGPGPEAENGNGEAVSTGSSLPAEGFFLPDYGSWIGARWSEIPLSGWIQGAPPDLEEGLRYVLLYRKDCEHCHELMEAWFSTAPPAPTLAVSVPERNGYPTENLQEFNCGECDMAELPAGVDWFFQTPVLIRLRDGLVECAAEVLAEDPQCIEF